MIKSKQFKSFPRECIGGRYITKYHIFNTSSCRKINLKTAVASYDRNIFKNNARFSYTTGNSFDINALRS